MKKNSINLDSIVGEETVIRQARTNKLDRLIADRYEEGYLIKDIVEEFNISQGSVYNSLSREGVPLRSTVNNSKSATRIESMSQLEKLTLKQDYLKGMPLEQIYQKYDINKHGCYMLLDELGVGRRREGNDTVKEESTQREPQGKTAEDLKEEMIREAEEMMFRGSEKKQEKEENIIPRVNLTGKVIEKETVSNKDVEITVKNNTNQPIESITVLFK